MSQDNDLHDRATPPDSEPPPPTPVGACEPTTAPTDAPSGPPATAAAVDSVATFVDSLFSNVPPGTIEVRLIEDGVRRAKVEREWYAGAEPLLAALPSLLQRSEQHRYGVFFGVLPRRESGKGKAEDVGDGLVAWVDIDFKDFAGGEAEARERLGQFPLQPSVIVRSGHGLHLYWLLREPTAPPELSALSKRLARHLGGDKAFDAARILRLPGTYNRKDPANPILVEVESQDSARAYNPSELAEALDVAGAPSAKVEPSPVGEAEPFVAQPSGELHASIRALIQKRKRIGSLFNGEGKPEFGPDGKPLDKTSSGYDFSLLLALVREGVRDPSALASALWHRPDGAAQAKGTDYITRTVRNALDLIEKTEQDSTNLAVDFKVERVRVFDCNPARYEFTVNGVAFTVTSSQLRSPRQFAVAFMDALRWVPQLPSKPADWAAVVNQWLKTGETVQMPPDASHGPSLQERVERIVEEMVVGDAFEDLDRGKAVRLANGTKGFRLAAVLRALKDDYPQVGRSDLGPVLRGLGFATHGTTRNGRPVRMWRFVDTTPDTRAGKS